MGTIQFQDVSLISGLNEVIRLILAGLMLVVCEDKFTRVPFAFAGSWVDDQRSGFGKHYYVNGDIYEGEWQNHVRHGQGVYTYAETGKKVQKYHRLQICCC